MIKNREMTEQDIGFVVTCLDNTSEEFMNQWGGGRWYTYPVTIDQMRTKCSTRKENTRYFIIQDDNTNIGSVELDFIDWNTKESGICRFLVAEEYRSKGIGTKALKALSDYAFSTMGMNKVKLSVFDFNTSAIRCYEKAGFIEYSRVKRDNGWTAIEMELYNPPGKKGAIDEDHG